MDGTEVPEGGEGAYWDQLEEGARGQLTVR